MTEELSPPLARIEVRDSCHDVIARRYTVNVDYFTLTARLCRYRVVVQDDRAIQMHEIDAHTGQRVTFWVPDALAKGSELRAICDEAVKHTRRGVT